ncbi:unnamed protein product, partial [Sphenostylis stenocarpa]
MKMGLNAKCGSIEESHKIFNSTNQRDIAMLESPLSYKDLCKCSTAGRSLFSACRVSGHVELGTYVAKMAISCDPIDSRSYILLSNIFESKSRWTDLKS